MEKFKKFLNLNSLTKSYKNYCINPNGINDHFFLNFIFFITFYFIDLK